MFSFDLSSCIPLIFNALEQQLFYSSIIFAVFLPAIGFFRNKHPYIAAGLCWLVIVRLFVPTDWSSPISLRALVDVFFFYLDSPPAELPLVPGATETIDHANHTAPGTQAALITWQLLFLSIWIVIAGLLLIRLALLRARIARLLNNAEPVASSEITAVVREWAGRLKIKRPIDLRTSTHRDFAFTVGIFRPKIFIPINILQTASHDELRLLLAHEIMHIKRGDDLVVLVLSIVKCLFFFFPPVWFCFSIIKSCGEKLCDAAVIRHGNIRITDYCATLLSIVHGMNISNSTLVSIAGHDSELKQRIVYLCEESPMKKLNIKVTATALTLTGLFCLPMGSSYATRAMGDPAFNSPVKIGRISSTYGERPWPIGEEKGKIKFHKGVDIAGKSGSAIYAVNTGTVIEVEKDYKNASNPQLGNYIVVDHGNNMESRYFHLLDVNVEKGQRVGTDRPIGTMGNTGQTTGAHLHFELYNQGSHVNPADYILFALENDPK